MIEQQLEAETRTLWEGLVAGLKAYNAGDIEASVAYWTDDCIVTLIGVPPGDPDTYVGKEQVRAWLNKLFHTDHFEIEEELVGIEGDTVTVKARSWSDTTRQLGVAPLEATEVYVTTGGKIRSLIWTISPRSAEALKAALTATPRT